jgi:hypothetical protein
VQHQFTTLSTAALLDALCETVDYVRGSTAPDAWQRAVSRAWDYLLQVEAVEYDAEAHAIRVESATRPGRFYVANGECSCEAYTRGDGVCWHRAAARLLRRALELRAMAQASAEAVEVEELAVELVAEAAEAGAAWYSVADAMAGARSRLGELESFAADWDRMAEAQRLAAGAALGARLAAARAAYILAA